MIRSIILVILILGFTFATAPVARADCYHDGQWYPTGTQIGPFVCMPDGTWQRDK